MYLMTTTTRHVALDPRTGSVLRTATTVEIDAYRAAECAARHGILRGAVRCGAVWALWLALAPGVTLEQIAAALRGDR